MKILIFGAQGRLGQQLTNDLSLNHEIFPLARFNVDISNLMPLNKLVEDLNPDLIINTVGLTSDHIKITKEQIWQSNTIGAVNIAVICQEKNIPLLHISCNSVLAGSKDKSVAAIPKALDLIGQSKLEAEELISQLKSNQYFPVYIIRTGALFGEYGHSIVKQLTRLLAKESNTSLPSDHKFSLTSTKMVSNLIQSYLNKKISLQFINHCCYLDPISDFDLAAKIVNLMSFKNDLNSFLMKEIEEEATDYSLQPSYNIDENLDEELLRIIS